jgi:hypothetical protein
LLPPELEPLPALLPPVLPPPLVLPPALDVTPPPDPPDEDPFWPGVPGELVELLQACNAAARTKNQKDGPLMMTPSFVAASTRASGERAKRPCCLRLLAALKHASGLEQTVGNVP